MTHSSDNQLNRRTVLAGAAAVAAPVPALASISDGPDPIFAAIDAHRTALVAAKGSPDDAGHVVEIGDDALTLLCDAEVAAAGAMLAMPPTTLAGLRALLRHVSECQAAGDDILNTHQDDFHRTLLTALESL